jgi:hypothetical protein
MDKVCSMHERGEKCVYDFNVKNLSERKKS